MLLLSTSPFLLIYYLILVIAHLNGDIHLLNNRKSCTLVSFPVQPRVPDTRSSADPSMTWLRCWSSWLSVSKIDFRQQTLVLTAHMPSCPRSPSVFLRPPPTENMSVWLLSLLVIIHLTSYHAFAGSLLRQSARDIGSSPPSIMLDGANVTGVSQGALSKFLGIPYAQPP